MLNRLWLGCFFVALAWGFGRAFLGEPAVLSAMVQSLFDMARASVDIMLVLLGTLTLWLGILKIAEASGVVALLARALGPLFARLMPEVPPNHPALGLITLNFTANALGLDNAATPIGLKAMAALQELNPNPDTATNAQILFLVMNASSLTLLPVTIFIFRAQAGSAQPALVFLPILIATAASTLAGLASVAWMQKLRVLDKVVLAYFAGIGAVLGLLISLAAGLSMHTAAWLKPWIRLWGLEHTDVGVFSTLLGNGALLGLMAFFLAMAAHKRLQAYDLFIEGAKEAFDVVKNLLPYLLAMLCAVGMLRSSGALDGLLSGLRALASALGWDARFVDAMPVALVKPFSGSAARALMLETMKHFGPDSFPALVAATMQGSTETTFYVLAVYFGSVGVTRVRHAIGCALLADLAGVVASVMVCYAFFG